MRVLRSYLGDWILVIVLWILLGALNRLPGHKREFSLTDITIQYPFTNEHVPPWLLFAVSLFTPLLFVAMVGGFVYRNKWDVHNGVLGVFIGYTVTGVVTQIVKMVVGRPRPDMLNRCLPRADAHDPPFFGLSNAADTCTSTDMLKLNDGFKSFPSGHSSLSFAGLGFLSFYLAGKLHLADKRGHRTRAWLALSPLLGSTLVAASRTADNRHHWQDVTVGSLLGISIAYVAYRAYFPSLSHTSAHLPLAPRDLPQPIQHGFGGDPEEYDEEAQRLAFDEEDGEAVVARFSEDERAWMREEERNGRA